MGRKEEDKPAATEVVNSGDLVDLLADSDEENELVEKVYSPLVKQAVQHYRKSSQVLIQSRHNTRLEEKEKISSWSRC
jgi:hypothetical protein